MTIKIPHTELEQCRDNVAEWVSAKKGGDQSFFGPGYNQYLRNAIHGMHKYERSPGAVRKELEGKIAGSDRLKDKGKLAQTLGRFDSYVQWWLSSASHVAATRVGLQFPHGESVQLSGIVWRVDVTLDGLRGVLLDEAPGDWRSQLRFPLIQAALAARYGYPRSEIEVGYHALDGSSFELETFGPAAIGEALREFDETRRQVEAEWNR